MVWRRRLFQSFTYFCYRAYLTARSQEYARIFLRRCKLHTPTALLALTGFSYKDSLSDEKIANELNSVDNIGKSKKLDEGWELVTEEKDYQVLRRIHSGSIYEYRCSGTYYDITARGFIEAQCDLDFRKTWDHNVITLKVLETNPSNETETVKWVAKYPYPMNARVYYYIRRKKIDHEHQKIVVLSQVLDEKEYSTEKEDKKYVRVITYRSNMVVKAHTNLDENGFDYVLTYYDDPQASIPMPAYYWIVSYGGPTFLKHVHDVAIKWQKNVFPKMKQLFEATQSKAQGAGVSPDTAKIEAEEPDQETSIAEKVLTKLAKIKEETLSKIAESKMKETKDEETQTDEVTRPNSAEKFLKNIFDAIQKWEENVASKIEKITDPFHPEREQQVVEEHQPTKVNQSPKEESTPTTKVMSQEKVQPAESSKAPQSMLKSMKKESGVLVEVVQHSPLEVVKPKLVEESEKKAKEENKENQKL